MIITNIRSFIKTHFDKLFHLGNGTIFSEVILLDNHLKKIRMTEYMMSAKDFAEMLNIEYSTYRGWEKGRSQPPLKIAIEIAKKLNRNVENIWQ